MSRLDAVAARVRESFPEALAETPAGARVDLGEDVLVAGRENLVAVLTLLRDECGFDMLADLSSVDWYPREPRFHVHYHLYSFAHNDRLRVKVMLPGDDPVVASAVSVWPTADWQEREAFDLMGITFAGHPNLKRIIMPDEWVGHPLRKDYAIGGVPVEYRIEPAYVGAEEVSADGRPSKGGLPPRLKRDRGSKSPWTWTG
ncbi:MAG TPA: NADH-quinone oxidoreductase subunit C [Actinomycetes bacterium]|nr:NADH-quinone oxidoreductase subunit C [Actinomycetes bacterium]